MKKVVFDVMCDDRFVMQYSYKWASIFPLEEEDVIAEIIALRPTLKGRNIKIFRTDNILKK